VIIESKLSFQGYNADDENNIMDILNQIAFNKDFHKSYRDIATNWIYEINKPTRRFKRITADDLEIDDVKRKPKQEDIP
jgi:chromodomain-helicase-DNA-binding protein 7